MSDEPEPEEDFIDVALDAALGFFFLVDGEPEPGLLAKEEDE